MQNGTAKASGFDIPLPRPLGVERGVVGLRPEAITDRTEGAGATLEMKVDVVERLGSDQFLYGQVGGDTLTARVEPRMKVEPGDKVRLGVDLRSLHVFDAQTEEALV